MNSKGRADGKPDEKTDGPDGQDEPGAQDGRDDVLTPLTDPANLRMHDLADGDVRADPAWRELVGLPPLDGG